MSNTVHYSPDLKQAQLDFPIGTRVDLLTKLEEAFLQNTHTTCSISGSTPERLETNFPSMETHSKHWNLNKKQHAAFRGEGGKEVVVGISWVFFKITHTNFYAKILKFG